MQEDKNTVLSQAKPRDAGVNFDTYYVGSLFKAYLILFVAVELACGYSFVLKYCRAFVKSARLCDVLPLMNVA